MTTSLVATSAWRVMRADDDRVAFARDAAELREAAEIDDRASARRAAASWSGAASGRRPAPWRLRWRERRRRALRGWRDASRRRRTWSRSPERLAKEPRRATPRLDSCHSAARFSADFCAARQTTCGVAGMAMSSWPSASVIALITAGGEAIAPASPQPLMPSGFDGQAVSTVVDDERRQVVGARHAVVHVARGQQLAVRRCRPRLPAAPGRCPARCRRAPGPRRSSD